MNFKKCWVQGRIGLPSVIMAFVAIAGLTLFSGCEPASTKTASTTSASTTSASTNSASTTTKTTADAHNHAHGDEGEHGGHLVHLEPSGEHAEWLHDDEKGTVTVFMEEAVSEGAKVDSVRVDLEVTGNLKKMYQLDASSDEHKIANSVFTIKSPELVTALGVGEGVKATLVVTIDGKEQSCKLEHDHGHDHDHDH